MINFTSDRLTQQLNFLQEIDKLKTIFRRTNLIADASRLENTAEHSWHLAIYVMILSEYTNNKIDISRVVKMVLLHDLVEIDAGDTFCYDENAHLDKAEREQRAADRIFGLLPADQCEEFMSLWHEFESRTTPEDKFAVSMDCLQPVIHNYVTGGGTWKRYQIKRQQAEKRTRPVKDGSDVLGDLIQSILDESFTEENFNEK